jgi:hypothetical protein
LGEPDKVSLDCIYVPVDDVIDRFLLDHGDPSPFREQLRKDWPLDEFCLNSQKWSSCKRD